MAATTVRPAEIADYAALPEIERRAAERFRNVPGYEGLTRLAVPDAESYRVLPPGAHVFVAEAGKPVGFVLGFDLDDACYLAEISVLPGNQGQGVGTALIDAVIARARARGKSGVVLTTFRDIPWNAPFYARLGFHALDPEQQGPALAHRGRRDADQFAHYGSRIVMGYLF